MSDVQLPLREGHEPEDFSIEVELDRIEAHLKGKYPLAKRSVALFLLQEDKDIQQMVQKMDPDSFGHIVAHVEHVKKHYAHPLDYVIASRRQDEAADIAARVFRQGKPVGRTPAEALSRLMVHPLMGFPILFLVLYWGLYKTVGQFGAGTLVDLLEDHLFANWLNPFFIGLSDKWIPWPVIRELFTGEYGILTLGLRYAVAIILPIVAVFFLVFAVIEDTGYLPRLALLIDRVFKQMGLSGRAVIPMVLGFGCATMATMVTRTLPTKRERLIATLLLALAVPCSAQLGVILALVGGKPAVLSLWLLVMLGVFLFIGFLAARVLPGERPSFYMEVPPLRWPKPANVLQKTWSRVWWYCEEIIPIFIGASVLIWFAQLTGFFDLMGAVLKWPVEWMGLPAKATTVFIFGFFRRDYGAAGLYDMEKAGMLDHVQLLTACVALALFLPCVAQFLMNVKERGWKSATLISLFVFVFAFVVAGILNAVLRAMGVTL